MYTAVTADMLGSELAQTSSIPNPINSVPRAQLHTGRTPIPLGTTTPSKHNRKSTQHVQSCVAANLQSNVAIDLIQLVNQLVDLLHDKGLALPHRAALVLLAGLCLRARFCLWGKGDGGAGAR